MLFKVCRRIVRSQDGTFLFMYHDPKEFDLVSWNETFFLVCLQCDLFQLDTGRKTITGSFIGSMKETEEMLAFCKEKGLASTIEVVKLDYLNTAIERLEKNDVRYRFVVDVAGSPKVDH